MKAVLLCQSLYCQFEGHDVVSGGEGIGVFEVDLMLAGSSLMMAGLYCHPHFFQRQSYLTAGTFAMVQGT